MIGIDLHDADIVADLATAESRRTAIDGVAALSGGALDGAVMFAGLGGATGRPASLLVSVNYFGAVELLAAFRPLLARWVRRQAPAPDWAGSGIRLRVGDLLRRGHRRPATAGDWPARWDLPHRTA